MKASGCVRLSARKRENANGPEGGVIKGKERNDEVSNSGGRKTGNAERNNQSPNMSRQEDYQAVARVVSKKRPSPFFGEDRDGALSTPSLQVSGEEGRREGDS